MWVIVSEQATSKYFLTVQQADQPGNPWGIPAGRVSCVDKTVNDAGIRELEEETGLKIKPKDLEYLTWYWKYYRRNKGCLIYKVDVDINILDIKNPKPMENGTIIFEPPSGVDRQEICQLALIPLELAFQPNLLNTSTYRRHETYKGLIALRNTGLIHGSFDFEDDPYL